MSDNEIDAALDTAHEFTSQGLVEALNGLERQLDEWFAEEQAERLQ